MTRIFADAIDGYATEVTAVGQSVRCSSTAKQKLSEGFGEQPVGGGVRNPERGGGRSLVLLVIRESTVLASGLGRQPVKAALDCPVVRSPAPGYCRSGSSGLPQHVLDKALHPIYLRAT